MNRIVSPPFEWPPAPDAAQLEREVYQSHLDARRIAAKRRRENRREWLREGVCALALVACGVGAYIVFGIR